MWKPTAESACEKSCRQSRVGISLVQISEALQPQGEAHQPEDDFQTPREAYLDTAGAGMMPGR